MNALIEDIYATRRVHDANGNAYTLHSEVDKFAGELLYMLIASDPTIRKTLEIGCAYGLSSLHICSALANRLDAKHVIIDPVQHSYWHGVGIHNLNCADLRFFELIEKPSEFIMPILAQEAPSTYDLVFIDGMHTFDHVLLDFFYANHLIRTGGYVVLDDCTLASISRVVSYVSKYPSYRILHQFSHDLHKKSCINRTARMARFLFPASLAAHLLPKNLYDRYYSRIMYPRMVVLQKVGEDKRRWDWFVAF